MNLYSLDVVYPKPIFKYGGGKMIHKFEKAYAGCAFLLVLACGNTLAATPAPDAGISSLGKLHTPLPVPYDESRDANAATVDRRITEALAEARLEHKLLLIDLGYNTCGDCRVLAGIMELPNVKRYVSEHYVTISIDVGGRMTKNLQAAQRFGVTKLEGAPSVLVIDPLSNRLVNAGHVAALADAVRMTPQALADWLAQWPS